MESQIIEIGLTEWQVDNPNQEWITALEAGKVLYFPQLAFQLLESERKLLDPAVRDPKSRNISLDARGHIKGAAGGTEQQLALAAMVGRFREQALALVHTLLPKYRDALRIAPTSYRPMQVETRAQSWRADDRRMHVDAFPSRPNYGERILRVFTNVNPDGVPRVWRVGEPFETVARRFLPRAKPYVRWQASVLKALHVTKSFRSEYDHLMLQLHDGMKGDMQYQQDAQQVTMPFAAGSVWICFSDQASHAVMSGQYMMEQTLHLAPEQQYDPQSSPLAILTRLVGHPWSEMRLLYSFIWWLMLPLVLLRLWWRGRKEPGYRAHVGERLGFYSQDARLSDPQGRFIWVHAVSVGETRAAEPLIDALLAQYPQHSVLLTCMTATGRATGAQVFGRHGMRVVQSFLPYDTGWMCARFLRHFRPAVCVLMETEVWPNLIEQCRRHQVPIMLANARLSERSLRRGRRLGALLRPAAAAIDVVAAQSVADADRLRAFGARRVEVTGSLKFDVQPPVEMVERGLAWKRAIGQRRILLCASTREGEEALILDALVTLGCTDWLTVIVPRHPQRFDEVATMIQSRALRMRRRTQLEQGGRWDEVDVMLGDSMGEMFAYYALCDVAFVGGSLLPLGGQNLIEALALGKPVLVGEYTFNFGSITEEAVRDGAAHRVEDAPALLGHWLSLMDDPQRLSRMSQAAVSYGLHHQGPLYAAWHC